MSRTRNRSLLIVPMLAAAAASTAAWAQDPVATPPLDCATRGPGQWLADFQAAVARGEIPDPKTRPAAALPPPQMESAGAPSCLTREHIFTYEDTAGVLVTNFTDGQLLQLMLDAGNALLATYGDSYDFIAFWVNFTPHHTIGTAFYIGVVNDVDGIGQAQFDAHADIGLSGERVEGGVMMWDINSEFWQPGDGSDADFTRLVLGQEFEHRWGMYLPPLTDGRVVQGDDADCGRSAHWSWRVDGQGSGMEISEWVGAAPAIAVGIDLSFNTDTGGVFSYADLYLMGYVSPEEMDAGNSELRFMDESEACFPTYFGPISDFTSADIIAAAGERVPSSERSQKDFRTAWVMLHQPGAPPTDAELDKAVAILEQHTADWEFSTLGRGTMNNSLFADCNCNGTPDDEDISGGGSADVNVNAIPDECECFADVDGSGNVDVVDMLALLGAWGTDPAGPPDFDGDGTVGVTDLLALFAGWGGCP